ncbi:MAG: acyl-CoA dehydrogenase family protein [Gammaproteobacteria bacterium]|nr:acyl-CoA dehydrogenase family protein [Gammaproteobacteria bacterium]
MNFELSDEQRLLQDSVARFVQDNYELENRIKLVATSQGFSSELWTTIAELGWLALPFDEADGGFGGSPIEIMVIMEQLGKGLVLEPFFANVVLGGGVLKRAANAQQKAELLPAFIEGTRQLTLAYAEEQARFDLHDVTTTARADGDAFVINGHKSMVANAATATQLIVSTRTSGGQVDENGISLFLVDADADGVSLENFPTVDGLRASEVTFTDVRIDAKNLLGELDQGFVTLNAVANDAILALCAEAVGAMEVLYKDTVTYTQEREQFGHPLAEFQVLQHRMVEMFMEYEQCKSLLYRATLEAAQGDSATAQRSVHALKHLVGKTGILIGENAVQTHGGMGMTEELKIGHYFKRLLIIDAQFGNADFHLQKFAA